MSFETTSYFCTMVEELRKYISENNLISRSDRILLAVSGGIDSMVMAHLFLSLKAKTGIAHCNFQLRGNESDEDENFVELFADENDIPFFVQRFDTSGFADEKGISIQMAARELRYRWFEEIRHNNNYSLISIAHNLNDNVETFLINLSRGTGIAGLCGMKPMHNKIIRPLLFATRKAIKEYADINNVQFREDRSNAEIKYTRNKIRHVIIPQFKTINPSFEATITETAERLNEINEIIGSRLAEIREKVSIRRENETAFRIKSLQNLYPLKTMLFELFKPYGINKGQLDDLSGLIKSRTGSQIMTGEFRIIKNRNELIVIKNEVRPEDSFIVTSLADFRNFPGCISAEIKNIDPYFRITDNQNIACLDAGKISFPMCFRRWKHGDSFFPLGMQQKKKLSDYFVDNKYSAPDKENCLILESDGRITWIVRDRIDNRYRITSKSKKVLLIEMNDQGRRH
jgi:tRNA(Ile)-lysidine synthase